MNDGKQREDERADAWYRERVVRWLDERDRLRARVSELEAERDAAYQRGAESMRERAAAECEARARYVQDADMTSAYELRTVAAKILALPLDDGGDS